MVYDVQCLVTSIGSPVSLSSFSTTEEIYVHDTCTKPGNRKLSINYLFSFDHDL